ncbi:hypothetical protein CYMTET_20161 [Cymbomonas tetramitiformis]|uniref:Pectin acetylesterase n=1 Tax=Cymbomonas tetramitiformis TaxID=36881 RepID=A0AAE0G534_9CHLO|nr:hypothetical protein CYMTET_20161 [Cymbomonas tetramitiformis]
MAQGLEGVSGLFILREVAGADPLTNPHLTDWNIVFVGYCDGGSFSGHLENSITIEGTELFFRGRAVLRAVLESLLPQGLSAATDFILTGCSAGAVAAVLNCDPVQQLLHSLNVPVATRMRCMADAGFFLNSPDIHGRPKVSEDFQKVTQLHNISLSEECKQHPERQQDDCFFVQHALPFVKTPTFLVNSNTDSWSLKNVLFGNPHPRFIKKAAQKQYIAARLAVTSFEQEALSHFSNAFRIAMQQAIKPRIEALNSAKEKSKRHGTFSNACLTHCQTLTSTMWQRVRDRSGKYNIPYAFWQWYNESLDLLPTRTFTDIFDECTYPRCNSHCGN